MWIKKIENSNKPYNIQPILYNQIRTFVVNAFLYDFNLVIEEFDFYQQITPKMKTDLIQNTRVFKEFERSFAHFFEECERGFTNELIMSLYCRIYGPGKTVISYKSNVKEMYFIRQGLIEVFNNENDELQKEKPILFLPKQAFFGDYQILYELKSNCIFKTLEESPTDTDLPLGGSSDTIFMCCAKDDLKALCDLFPQTAENIKGRSLLRRKRIMKQKATNSRKYQIQAKQKNYNDNCTLEDESDEEFDAFYSDEEQDTFETQNEDDMQSNLEKLTKRVEGLA